MNTIQHNLEHCRKLIAEPSYRRDYLRSIANRKGGVVAYFSNYIPAELISAAGFHPLRILGRFAAGDGQPLPQPVCSFVQDVFAAARAGEFADLRGVIFPNSCDALKVLQQNWDSSRWPAVWSLRHPINTDASAVQYLAEQLKTLGGRLQSASCVAVSNERLTQMIVEYNELRDLCRKLYLLRQAGELTLDYADVLAVTTASLIMERSECTAMLLQLLKSCRCAPKAPGSKRILIAGPLMDHLALACQLEQLGAFIVSDDVTNGWRSCDRQTSIGGDPYANLARQILESHPSPTLYSPLADAAFLEHAAQANVKGVIFINQKFCEPHVHSYVARSGGLQKLNIKTLLIELEHGRPDAQEHDRLRIESFLELLT